MARGSRKTKARGRARPAPAWSVVVPFYNEQDFLGDTLRSLAAQSERSIQFVLIDNGSTDASPEIARAFKAAHPQFDVRILEEATPGKASALATGVAAAKGAYTAVCDADTFYPPDYLRAARRLFDAGGEETVAALAFGVSASSPLSSRLARAKGVAAAFLMPRQAHSGGYGQCFRTGALKSVGGFTPKIWPYCLMDHEIVHRLTRVGRIAYDWGHWCAPSPRRADRRRVRWTLGERLLYHATPHAAKDWFFYSFLRGRFEARGIGELNLRRKEWGPDADHAAASVLPDRRWANRATSASK